MGRLRGESKIRKRADGRWEGRITIGYDAHGKPVSKSFYDKTKKGVKEKMTPTEDDLKVGIDLYNQPLFYEWVCIWFDMYKRPILKPASIELYEGILSKYIEPAEISQKYVNEIQGHEFQMFLNGLTSSLTRSSIKRIRNLINNAMKQAVMSKLVAFNPCESTVVPNGTERQEFDEDEVIEYFTLFEQRQLTDYLVKSEKDFRLRAMVMLDLYTGLRLGEIIGLREVDVDLKRRELKVRGSVRRINEGLIYQKPKTKNSIRTVPIPSTIIPLLKDYVQLVSLQKKAAGHIYDDCGLFFKTEIGNILDPRNVRRAYQRMLNRADLPERKFHALRHTYATRLMELGESPKVVQKLLGHANITITLNIYSHVTDEKKEGAAEKLNSLF